MIMFVRLIVPICLSAALLSGTGCKASNNSDMPDVVVSETSIVNVTSNAHKALNAGDMQAFAETVSFPLAVRTHEWASLQGSYELTRPIDKMIGGESSLLSASDLAKVRMESEATDGSIISYDDVRENLEGSDYDWSNLTLIIYARGYGDVEHIVLFGVDDRSGKVKAIYYN